MPADPAAGAEWVAGQAEAHPALAERYAKLSDLCTRKPERHALWMRIAARSARAVPRSRLARCATRIAPARRSTP